PQLHSGLAQALEDEQPARKVGIDEDILAADLQKKAGMTDESHSHLTVGDELGLVGEAGSWRDRGMAYQAAKLPGTLAKCGILEGILQHRRLTRSESDPASIAGSGRAVSNSKTNLC